MKPLPVLLGRSCRAILDALPRPPGLLGGCQLYEIGGKEVARDEDVQPQADEDILAAVVVAPDADQDAVLSHISFGFSAVQEENQYLLQVLNHEAQVADHCVKCQ